MKINKNPFGFYRDICSLSHKTTVREGKGCQKNLILSEIRLQNKILKQKQKNYHQPLMVSEQQQNKSGVS